MEKGNTLNRLMSLGINLINTEMLLYGILEGQSRDFSLVLNQLDGLIRSVHIVVRGIAAGLAYTIGARLQIIEHCFTVLICGDGSEVCIIPSIPNFVETSNKV